MGVLGKSEWKQRKPRHKEFEVEGLGLVRIQPLMQADWIAARGVFSANEDIEEDEAAAESRGISVIFPTLLAMAVVDENGEHVFDGPDDPTIKELEFRHLMSIGAEIQSFWGLGEQETVTPKN